MDDVTSPRHQKLANFDHVLDDSHNTAAYTCNINLFMCCYFKNVREYQCANKNFLTGLFRDDEYKNYYFISRQTYAPSVPFVILRIHDLLEHKNRINNARILEKKQAAI